LLFGKIKPNCVSLDWKIENYENDQAYQHRPNDGQPKHPINDEGDPGSYQQAS